MSKRAHSQPAMHAGAAVAGYVPLPKPLEPAAAEAPEPAAAARPALPPANNFGAFTSEPPPADPTGTNVFADPK
jgi:hypothetical protein